MHDIEIRVHDEPHLDCGGEIEIRIDRNYLRVITVCRKCRIGTVIENGKVLVDGEKIED